MNVDIPIFLKKLNLRVDQRAASKAQEIQNLLNAKRGTNLKEEKQCQAAVCVELGCLATGHNFPREHALRVLGVKPSSYEKVLKAAKVKVGIKSNLTFSSLCAKYGTENIADLCERSFKRFRLAYRSRHGDQDTGHPKYIAAVYLLCCQARKLPARKNELLADSTVKASEFNQLISDIQELMPELQKSGANRKRKAPINSDDEENGADEEPVPPTTKRARAGQSAPATTQKTPPTLHGSRMAAQASAKTPPAGEKSAKKKLTFGMQHAAKTPSKLGPSGAIQRAAASQAPRTPGSISHLAKSLLSSRLPGNGAGKGGSSHRPGMDVSPYADMEYAEWKQLMLETIDSKLAAMSAATAS